jgi:hypothetical protein
MMYFEYESHSEFVSLLFKAIDQGILEEWLYIELDHIESNN